MHAHARGGYGAKKEITFTQQDGAHIGLPKFLDACEPSIESMD